MFSFCYNKCYRRINIIKMYDIILIFIIMICSVRDARARARAPAMGCAVVARQAKRTRHVIYGRPRTFHENR